MLQIKPPSKAFLRLQSARNVLLVVAHPDDELVTFGPLVANIHNHNFDNPDSPIKLHVVCLTNPNLSRFADFQKSAGIFGFSAYNLNQPDDPEQDLRDPYMVEGLTELVHRIEPDVIVTHDPISGDLGCHRHHQSAGMIVHQIVSNLRSFKPQVLYRYTEGHCVNPVVISSNPDVYTQLLRGIRDCYTGEVSHLEREKYPMSSTLLLGTYNPSYLDAMLLRWVYNEHIPAEDFSHIEDPWFTRTSPYEQFKSDASAEFISETLIRELSSTAKIHWIDVGTGIGYTLGSVLSELRSLDVCINGLSIIEVGEAYHKHYPTRFKSFEYNSLQSFEEFDNHTVKPESTKVLSLMQAIYYFKSDDLFGLLTHINPDVVYIESDYWDEHAVVLSELGYKKLASKKDGLFLDHFRTIAVNSDEASDSDINPIEFVDSQEYHLFMKG